jgi:putative two-component system response regulator
VAEKKIILAVDDIPGNLILINSLLKGYFDVRLAKSAEMALNLVNKVKVDLILLDIVMPEVSGFDFLKMLHAKDMLNTQTPVIIVTAHANVDILNQAIKLGAKDYIVKPIIPETLYKKIDAIIGIPEDIPNAIKELIPAVASANKFQAITLIRELLGLSQDIPPIRNSVEEIAKLINNLEYEKGLKKIKLLFDAAKLYEH